MSSRDTDRLQPLRVQGPPPQLPAVTQVSVITATWTDLPKAIVSEVRELWLREGYENEHSYHSWRAAVDTQLCPFLADYMRERSLPDGTLIHLWW